MSKLMPTLRRLGRCFLRKATLALLTSLLFLLSFTLFQYASWWPMLTEDDSLHWGGYFQGRTFTELALPMLEFGALLGALFWPLFLLAPRLLLPPLFTVLWLWQAYETAFVTASASTWLPHEIIWAFILPHTHWLLLTLLPPLLLICHLGRRLLATVPETQSGASIMSAKS
ncbi:hypothetical protein [Aeromonas tecta]|uniref:hypothetical protein n=1 Tax=Aeromonas tecta TaxID=324617 RepID=UPI0012F8DD07|nr:hypothetical protein [Aeromonas tecta]